MKASPTTFAFVLLIAVCAAAQSQRCSVRVPAGTEIPLLLANEIDPRSAHAGDKGHFLLTDDFAIEGCAVAVKNTDVVALIEQIVPPRSFGRHGRVLLRIAGVPAIDGQLLTVDEAYAASQSPPPQPGATRGLLLPAAPLWLMIEGWHAVIPRGTLLSVATSRAVTVSGRALPEAPPSASDAPATITIFQSKVERPPELDALFSGGVSMRCFERGAHFQISLAPGTYRLGHSKEPLQLEPGRSYYFRAYNNGSGALELASAGEFAFFAPELHPLPEKCQSRLQHSLFKFIVPRSKSGPR